MVKIMKKQTKIYILNFATVIFGLLTVVSLGSLGTLPLYNVIINTALFGLLAYTCAEKETALRKSMKRKSRKPQLSVYRQKSAHTAA